jgi:hypothetical protein
VLGLQRGDVLLEEPDRNLDRDRDAVVGEHEALEFRVALVIAADGRHDEGGRLGRDVLLLDDHERIDREEARGEL